jgi:cbb3-type cytochrome oxidase maturation protein
MSVIVILILVSLTVAGVFLAAFIWAVRSGQFEDTGTPPLRILMEESPATGPSPSAAARRDPETA